jgi:hypothetical protein
MIKLTQIAQILTAPLLAALAYIGWEALQVNRENNTKMAAITKYVDAVAAQVDAQKKAQADAGVPGLVTPMNFNPSVSSGTTGPALGSTPTANHVAETQPTVTASPHSTISTKGTAGSAPAAYSPLPAPVETPQMRLIKAAPSLGQVTTVDAANGFVTLNVGSTNGLKTGQIFQLRRDSSVVGTIRTTLVEPEESAADLDPKSVPTGLSIQPGDQLISPIVSP